MWVENKKVPDRMIAVLEDVRKVVKFCDKLTKSKQPNSKSYSNLKNGLDEFMPSWIFLAMLLILLRHF